MQNSTYKLLNKINFPADLKKLNLNELLELKNELRNFLLKSVNQSSGHFASGLGVIELTIALHYYYNSPIDKIIWDVGHQAYPHKILTGRKNQIHTIRKQGGISPFPDIKESPFDALTVGHAGTSISAGLGMAISSRLSGINNNTISIIGDGSITSGMSLEALNHAGSLKENILVILNDNNMSISSNVGGLSKYFSNILTTNLYANIHNKSKQLLKGSPKLKNFMKKTEDHLKGFVNDEGTFFGTLGFYYLGPIDGHNIQELLSAFKHLSKIDGPKLLHIKTQKGKGYLPAEKDPTKYHSITINELVKKDKSTLNNSIKNKSYSETLGDFLIKEATNNKKIIAITPAMTEGSGLKEYAKKFKDQFFDTAITEQHAITLAAGLSLGGYKPIVAIYSSFLQRGYDQLIHDVAIPNLDVIFAIDRAGNVGNDGKTHHGVFDLSFLLPIPNLTILTPSSTKELRIMLKQALSLKGPVCIRYPKDSSTYQAPLHQTKNIYLNNKNIFIPNIMREGKNIIILNFGALLSEAINPSNQLNATLLDMKVIKPLNIKYILNILKSYKYVITLEDNTLISGAGSLISSLVHEYNLNLHVKSLGYKDYFIEHGSRKSILQNSDLDSKGIIKSINQFINSCN
ncbi:MAG: 1-deoxy-D-xylulose-5-phosphate synthase [Psittacicella sp.]